MKTLIVAAALAILPLVTLPDGSARAGDGAIEVAHPWLRATPKGASVAGGYVTITNKGREGDTLVGASLPMAKEGQVHTMSMNHGVMTMRRLDKGLPIPPGATVTLRPGGDHLMFLGLEGPIREGETVQGALDFAKAGAKAVRFAVGGVGAWTAPGQEGGVAPAKPMDMPGMH